MQEFERELLARRREHLILRVDRADLSKNVLRGFSAFDLFLEQHPEFRENVTFIAQLMPSRMDVPEYAEYLERIEALVAVVNHRHGTPDWMPIQLKLRDDLEEAVAAYKHYDVLLVNAMFDGMNLVAKEGPLVNERNGVSILSENTGAHEELGEFALSVNPFDIQETADSIHAALTMRDSERARRMEGLQRIVTQRDPGDWIDDQLADIRKKAGGGEAAAARAVGAERQRSGRRRDGPLSSGASGLRRRGLDRRGPTLRPQGDSRYGTANSRAPGRGARPAPGPARRGGRCGRGRRRPVRARPRGRLRLRAVPAPRRPAACGAARRRACARRCARLRARGRRRRVLDAHRRGRGGRQARRGAPQVRPGHDECGKRQDGGRASDVVPSESVHASTRRRGKTFAPLLQWPPPSGDSAMAAAKPTYDLMLLLDTAAPDEQRAKALAEASA